MRTCNFVTLPAVDARAWTTDCSLVRDILYAQITWDACLCILKIDMQLYSLQMMTSALHCGSILIERDAMSKIHLTTHAHGEGGTIP